MANIVTAWFCVETPSVFREIELPIDPEDMTAAQKRDYKAMVDLAQMHGTHVKQSGSRRG
jgi:hypothetical protein